MKEATKSFEWRNYKEGNKPSEKGAYLVYLRRDAFISYFKKEKKLREKENEYKHESKVVQLNDSECLRLVKIWEQEGYEVKWVHQYNIAARKSEGYVVLQEKDEQNRVIFDVFVKNTDRGNPDNLIPIGKKNS